MRAPMPKSKKKKSSPREKTPTPKVGKIEDWKEVIKKAVRKKHPDAGWPED
jgi:hypothetical protein